LNPHLDQPLERAGHDPRDARIVAVVVHGRSLNPAYMLEHLVSLLDQPDVAYLLPAADGDSWYPASFLEPIAANEPRLSYALERLEIIRDDLAAQGVADSRIVWVGFSQGACLVTEYVARSEHRFGALVSLTGGLIGPPDEPLTTPTAVAGMPAFFSGSDVDPFVPLERMGSSVNAFNAAGAETMQRVYPGASHEIVPEAVDLCGRILGLALERA
jgi:phospholipase/carboxylesterase